MPVEVLAAGMMQQRYLRQWQCGALVAATRRSGARDACWAPRAQRCRTPCLPARVARRRAAWARACRNRGVPALCRTWRRARRPALRGSPALPASARRYSRLPSVHGSQPCPPLLSLRQPASSFMKMTTALMTIRNAAGARREQGGAVSECTRATRHPGTHGSAAGGRLSQAARPATAPAASSAPGTPHALLLPAQPPPPSLTLTPEVVHCMDAADDRHLQPV